ncbi:MAG: dihydropyrimidinase [Nodosilinea sp.]
MAQVLIKGGRIITAVDDYQADILISDGRIEAIGRSLAPDNAEVHEAGGLMVFPGGIDAHVHMETPMGNDVYTCDSFETGTRSAAFGGTTTIIDFAQQFHNDSPKAALDRRLAAAEPQCCVDYAFHVILTDVNPGSLGELPDLINQDGVSSFKLYMAYPGVLMVDDAAIFKTMRRVGVHGGMVNLHAENGVVIQALVEEALEQGNTSPKYHQLTRPRLMEGEAAHRVIRIAELAEVPVYIVHLSAKEALEAVVEARDRGIPAFAETCPHYLFLDDSAYDAPGFEAAKYVMTPPLRDHECQHALWRGLRFDDLQLVATDHCPFCFNENPLGLLKSKQIGRDNFNRIPNGAPGVELRLTLFYAAEKQLFSKYGFSGTAALTPMPADVAVQLATGQVEMAVIPFTNAIAAYTQGASFQVVAGSGVEGLILVAKPEIKSFADLRGKKIATFQADTLDVVVYDYLKKNGMTYAAG